MLGCALFKVYVTCDHVLVHRLHKLARQRAVILDQAIGGRFDDTARAELLAEIGVLRVIKFFGSSAALR